MCEWLICKCNKVLYEFSLFYKTRKVCLDEKIYYFIVCLKTFKFICNLSKYLGNLKFKSFETLIRKVF